MAGGAGFRSEESGWLNQAMSNARQMGSCFKPFFYAAAFEYGHTPNEIIIDEPIEFSSGGRTYRPTNYERDGGVPVYFGPNTLIEALEHSRNVSTVRLFEALRISKALDVVRRFDFTYSQPQWDIKPYIPVCLGSVTSSPFVLASAYQVFANNGTGVRPQFVRSIVDSQGRVPFPIKRPEFDVIKPMSAFQMQYLMRQVVSQVEDGATGRAVGQAFPSPPYPPICGKTGTTDDCRDAWFGGYTPDLVIISQIGFDPPRSMAPGMTGGTTAAKELWIPAFREIYKTRKNWKMNFDQPGENVAYADICGKTGKVASEVCESSGHKIYRHVPFAQDRMPKSRCDGGILPPMVAPVRDFADMAPQSQTRGLAHATNGGGGGDETDTSPE
jgi:penicillin-binding protein 1A